MDVKKMDFENDHFDFVMDKAFIDCMFVKFLVI